MAPSEVLTLAKELSVRLWVDPTEGKVQASPVTRTTSELRAGIVANKTALLTLLKEPDANGRRGPPAPEEPDQNPEAVNSHSQHETEAAHAENFTIMPNRLFDLCKEKNLSASASVTFSQLWRLTEGFHRRSVVIALEALADRSNISRSTCKRALERLEEVKLIHRVQRKSKAGRVIAPIIYMLWRPEK